MFQDFGFCVRKCLSVGEEEALMVRRNAPRWIRMLHRYGRMECEPTAPV